MNKQLQILSYDPRWVIEFETERDRIAYLVGELAIRIDSGPGSCCKAYHRHSNLSEAVAASTSLC